MVKPLQNTPTAFKKTHKGQFLREFVFVVVVSHTHSIADIYPLANANYFFSPENWIDGQD